MRVPEEVTPPRADVCAVAIATAPGNREALQAAGELAAGAVRVSVRLSPPALSVLRSCRPPSPVLLSGVMAGVPGDVRKLFIFATTRNYFGLVSESWDHALLGNGPEINNFLDDGNQMLLRVQRSDSGIAFSNVVCLPAPRPGLLFRPGLSRTDAGSLGASWLESSSRARGCPFPTSCAGLSLHLVSKLASLLAEGSSQSAHWQRTITVFLVFFFFFLILHLRYN